MRIKKYNNYIESNETCKQCGSKMNEVSHGIIKEKTLKQLFYYKKWYKCSCGWQLNKNEDKVYNSKEFQEYENIQRELPSSIPLFQ